MWKLSCLLLLLITIGNSPTYADTVDTEASRNDRSRDDRQHRSEAKTVQYVEEERPYEEDYWRHDSDEFEGGKLIGKWRNNGAAFEPKWRDGDSVPLVPFNAAKQTKVGRHDVVGGSEHRDSSHAVTKPLAHEASVGRAPIEGSVEDTSTIADVYPPPSRAEKNFHAFEKNYENRYRDDDDSRAPSNEFPSRSKKTRPPTVLTDDLRYETTEDAETSGKSSNNEGKVESASSRSRHRDSFQVHPNEYELNDEEYQKPRPRKRRPPQNYEFSEMRAPTYSITWSTERYIESTPSPDRPEWTKDFEPTRRRSEKPHSARRDRNRTVGTDARRVSENTELKSLLKMQQTEGLSLSELLQRRNLTLNDLLKGKAEVISVLKASDSHEEDATELSNVKPKIFETKHVFGTTERPKWRPSQSRTRSSESGSQVSPAPKSANDVPASGRSKKKPEDEESSEHPDSAETEDGERKSNDNEKLSAIVRLTKPIILPRFDSFTEKPMVVATSSIAKELAQLYRHDESAVKIDKSPAAFDDDEIMEFSDFTVKKNVEITTVSAPETATTGSVNSRFEDAYEDTGSTLSIEHILGTTEQTVALSSAKTQQPNTFDTKVNSVAMVAAQPNDTDAFGLDSEYQSDEPREIADGRSEEELPMGDQPYEDPGNDDADQLTRDEETWKNHQVGSTSGKPYELVVSEVEPDARAEIFELFSSGSSAKRLERLLKSRNMSIDELIALRQRGSSKVHMAEVLRSRETQTSRSQKQRVNGDAIQFANAVYVGRTGENLPATTLDDLSDIEIETTSTEMPVNDVAEQQTNIASVATPSIFTTERTNVYSTEGKITKHVQLLELLTAFDSLPFSVRPDLDQKYSGETEIPSKNGDRTVLLADLVEKTKRPELPTSPIEIGSVKEIAKEDSVSSEDSKEETTNERTDYSPTLGEEKKSLSKVRPSIIASGAILGVTVVVFLAIFIVCRIRQKQKYTYRNTFSRAVFQGPVMTARKLSNTSSLNTIMVNVVATSTNKRPERTEQQAIDDEFDFKSDIENDSLDANDSWDTIPDFMK